LNIVTAKSGKLDEFISIQVAEQQVLRGSVAGVRGNRIYRSLDESKALMLASFDTPEDHKRWIQSNGFAEHVQKLLPLIERADRGYYNIVYEAGEI
jgi:heme-degrading monooxygenase HmoA